jgi:NO-binding membrane sensor protein with MHYT domain
MSNRLGLATACGALMLVAPGISAACSVCMTGREDETRIVYELMTGFMTLIPFVLAGGVFYWLRGRVKEIEASHERARAAARER